MRPPDDQQSGQLHHPGQGIANLNSELSVVQQEAYAGTALIAAAGLRWLPAKTARRRGTTSATAGYYHGQPGFAAGVGSTSPNEDWRFKASVTVTPGMNGIKADFGAIVGDAYPELGERRAREAYDRISRV